MDHKKIIISLLSGVLLISSGGGYIMAASDSDKMTNSVKEYVSNHNVVREQINASSPNVIFELGTEILQKNKSISEMLQVSLAEGTFIEQRNKQISIPFNQTLDTANTDQYALDLTIRKIAVTNTPMLVPMVDYTTAVEGNKIVVTFLGDYTDGYAVQVKDAVYIRANGKAAVQSAQYFTTKNMHADAEKLQVSLAEGTFIDQRNKQISIPFNQTLDTANTDQYALDLTIRKIAVTNTPMLVPMVDYTTAVEGNRIVVTFLGDYTDGYAVQVKDAVYIRANGKAAVQSAQYFTTKNMHTDPEKLQVSLAKGTFIEQRNKQISIPFNQTLDTANADLYVHDLTIRKIAVTNTPMLVPMVDYTTAVEGNKIVVTFLGDYTDGYAVQVKDAVYIRANGIAAVQSAQYFTTKNMHADAEKLQVSLAEGTFIDQRNKQISIPFNQTLDTANADLYVHDLTIRKIAVTNTPMLVPMVDYTTAVEGNRIVVTFLGDYTDGYAVQVKDAVYIRANGIAAVQSATYFTTKNMDSIM